MLEFEAAHLGGYDQTDLFTGKGPSKCHEVFYSAESTLGAVRIDLKYRFIDQPNGWFGSTVKPGWSILVNLRLDPYERAGLNASINYYNWYAYEFWRFVFVKDEVAKAAQTFLAFPPMQRGASFNLETLKQELEKKLAARARIRISAGLRTRSRPPRIVEARRRLRLSAVVQVFGRRNDGLATR